MIKMKGRVTASALWEIDGTEISLQYRKDKPESEVASKIIEYKQILQDKLYEHNNACLCEIFRFFGGISFVKIGMIFKAAFLSCFEYYARIFAVEWAAGEQCLCSKNIGYQYSFEIMLSPIKYDFRYILNKTSYGFHFCALMEKSFKDYWLPEIKQIMHDGKSLENVSRRVGDVRLSRYMMLIPNETELYVKALASGYTERRELISLRKMYHFIFGYTGVPDFPSEDEALCSMLRSVVSGGLALQVKKLPMENRISMNVNLDKWTLYRLHGVSLHYMTLDFTLIKQESMKQEIKCFMKNRLSGAFSMKSRILGILADAVNRICSNNPSIKHFADIDTVDVKMLQMSMESDNCTQRGIMSAFYHCRVVMEYLCGGERDEQIKAPIPFRNHFRDIAFVNAASYSKNTPYIPDCVLFELVKHTNELSKTDRLVFRIFNETGMRAKEVAFLSEDCLRKARYDGCVELKYIPYKTMNARRRAGLNDYHSVYISKELAADIAKQINESQTLREKCNLPYIFLHASNKQSMSSMLDISYFIIKINKLIKKHSICDDSGNLWNFTSRQCRKTLVVNMIENGARVEELAYQLGHLTHFTAMKYYAEVKAMKLADMNSKFFKHKFELDIKDGQLCRFTEEERRLLYVDMCLGYRRVEMGICVRKLCSGACRNTNAIHHCVSCPNLCTGNEYLSHWQRLLDSAKNELESMLEVYHQENIEDYSGFVEFNQKIALVSAYQDVVDRLNRKECSSL